MLKNYVQDMKSKQYRKNLNNEKEKTVNYDF